MNEGIADISNNEISNTTAKITWNSNTDISYILINNTRIIDFSYIFADLSSNTTYDFSFSTIFKTTNSYASNVSITTLNEQPPLYYINTYFDTLVSGDTISRIEVVNPSDVSSTVINISDTSYSISKSLDVSMANRFSSYSGNIVTTYNTKLPTGYYTYRTKPFVTDFSFLTIMYKPVYTVYSDKIEMKWYDVSSPPSNDVSYSIIITQSGKEVDTVNNTAGLNYVISDLSINTQYDISFIRSFFADRTTRTESESILTLNQGPILK